VDGNIEMVSTEKMLCKCEVVGDGSGLCPKAGVVISGVQSSGCTAR
jgi:hypothetical protein